MAWAETRRRLGGWLALAALTIQLVASFGHLHREDFVHARPGATVVTQANGGTSPLGGDPDLDCAICATVHLAGTLLLPAPPGIALPANTLLDRIAGADQDAAHRARVVAFNARGPPRT